jgi:rhodanese-related sulfurtransferase
MKQMTATELQQYLASGAKPYMIDVREKEELEFGMIGGATHIPMNDVPAHLQELAEHKNEPVVLICRSGKRSAQVGSFLEQNGFSDVINLEGGMNGWATDVDTSMTVY